jgi:hypothetical protein
MTVTRGSSLTLEEKEKEGEVEKEDDRTYTKTKIQNLVDYLLKQSCVCLVLVSQYKLYNRRYR